MLDPGTGQAGQDHGPAAARDTPRPGQPDDSAGSAERIVKPLPSEWFVRRNGLNAEMRWDSLGDVGYRIPNERFFVRNHAPTPVIDVDAWRLGVFGRGLGQRRDRDHAVRFGYDELRGLPARTVTTVLECAGNGRTLFESRQGTPAPGTPWGLGAVGAAQWTGVPLSDVLRRAGITPAAVSVLAEGLDDPVREEGVDLGRFRRALPVAKALDDTLIAYAMNGQPLPPDHGFPVRLIVPGWFGMASIKWLGWIEVSDRQLHSHWSTAEYRMIGPSYAGDEPPLGQGALNSAFELPSPAHLALGRRQWLHGRSWSGRGPVTRVEVSADHGASWAEAELMRPNLASAWVRWRYLWTPTRTGRHDLRARASDAAGRTQPDAVPYNTGGYGFCAATDHPVWVQRSEDLADPVEHRPAQHDLQHDADHAEHQAGGHDEHVLQ
jgi:DMSO/TMAO reductase YedYZ molybdopterin-dependent catalytic subunit